MSVTVIFVSLIALAIIIIVGLYFYKKNIRGQDDYIRPSLTKKQQQSNLAYNAYLPNPAWGPFTPANQKYQYIVGESGSTGSTGPYNPIVPLISGQCLNYARVAGQFFPAVPTYNDLNTAQGAGYIISSQTCLDPDQIFAQAGSHTCLAETSGSAGTGCYTTVKTPRFYTEIVGYTGLTGCTLYTGMTGSTLFTGLTGCIPFTGLTGTSAFNGFYLPGQKMRVGETEGVYNVDIGSGITNFPLYAPCNITDNTTSVQVDINNSSILCGGTLGIISPHFTPLANSQEPTSLCTISPTGPTNLCLSLNVDPNDNNTPYTFGINLQDCSLGEYTQLFRTVRYSIDSNYVLTKDEQGSFASIMFRQNGFYLAPKFYIDNSSGTPVYRFDELLKNYERSIPLGKDTIDLVLVDPQYDTSRNGVYWLLQDQTISAEYNPYNVPPQQYYGCNIQSITGEAIISQQNVNCSKGGLPTYYGPTGSLGPSSGTYTASAPIAPQQIVYIPNIYQFPTDLTDLSGYWSYLINQFSINQFVYNSLNETGLQLYRTSIPVNVNYETVNSILRVKNFGEGNAPTFPIVQNSNNYTDTQILSYTNIINSVQSGVSPISPGCCQGCLVASSTYSGNIYNPFSIAQAPILFKSPQDISSYVNKTQSSN